MNFLRELTKISNYSKQFTDLRTYSKKLRKHYAGKTFFFGKIGRSSVKSLEKARSIHYLKKYVLRCKARFHQ